MFTVYLIQSISQPGKKYTGYTANLEKRLEEHNKGKVNLTKNYVPWEVKVAIQFKSQEKAKDFERYLKHGSGFAFAKRHFW